MSIRLVMIIIYDDYRVLLSGIKQTQKELIDSDNDKDDH